MKKAGRTPAGWPATLIPVATKAHKPFLRTANGSFSPAVTFLTGTAAATSTYLTSPHKAGVHRKIWVTVLTPPHGNLLLHCLLTKRISTSPAAVPTGMAEPTFS